jgi:hypothetical protein
VAPVTQPGSMIILKSECVWKRLYVPSFLAPLLVGTNFSCPPLSLRKKQTAASGAQSALPVCDFLFNKGSLRIRPYTTCFLVRSSSAKVMTGFFCSSRNRVMRHTFWSNRSFVPFSYPHTNNRPLLCFLARYFPYYSMQIEEKRQESI